MDCPIHSRFPLPLRHFGLAAAAYLAFAAAFFAGRHGLLGFDVRARYVLGFVHLFTLGFVSTTILGVMCQMIPSHGGTHLRRPLAAAGGFLLLALGLSWFVGELWGGDERYWRGAAVAGGAVLLYLSSLVPTLAAAQRDFTARHFAGSLASLALLALLGVTLAIDQQRGVVLPDGDAALVVHVHLALVGWVSLAIMGGSYRLFFPMALTRAESRLPGRLAYGLVAAGLAGLVVDQLILGRRATVLWAVLLAGGYGSFAWQLKPLLQRDWSWDIASAAALLGMAGGAAWTVLGLSLALGWLEDRWEARAAYVFCALLGWAAPWILGQSHKILPFLTWRVAEQAGKTPPPYEEMTLPWLSWLSLAALAAAVPCGVAGFLCERQAVLSAASALVLASAAAWAAQAAYVLRRLL
jgi:hypothetical protein